VVDPPFKLVWRWFRNRRESHLFDLSRDPAEAADLARRLTVRREYLEQLIARERFGLEPLWKQPKETPEEDLRQKMKALGYVN
jgi:hypothetical protein